MLNFCVSGLLYRFTLAVAFVLILLVIAAPWLDNTVSSRLLAVFAQDRTLRRTAVASAVGLVVTACVCFRPAGAARRARSKGRQVPPPPSIAGA